MKRLRDIVWIPDFVLSVRKGDSDPGSPALDCMCVCGGVFFFVISWLRPKKFSSEGFFFCLFLSKWEAAYEGGMDVKKKEQLDDQPSFTSVLVFTKYFILPMGVRLNGAEKNFGVKRISLLRCIPRNFHTERQRGFLALRRLPMYPRMIPRHVSFLRDSIPASSGRSQIMSSHSKTTCLHCCWPTHGHPRRERSVQLCVEWNGHLFQLTNAPSSFDAAVIWTFGGARFFDNYWKLPLYKRFRKALPNEPTPTHGNDFAYEAVLTLLGGELPAVNLLFWTLKLVWC